MHTHKVACSGKRAASAKPHVQALALLGVLLMAMVPFPSAACTEGIGASRAQIDVPLDTQVIPFIDGIWSAGEWDSAVSVSCTRSINGNAYFKSDGATLYMLVDVLGDITNDSTGATDWEVCLIGFDGEADGSTVNQNTGITYANQGVPAQPSQTPITDPPPTNKCVDRWAQIYGNKTSSFGWMNKDPGTGTAMLWYRQNLQNQPWPPTSDPYDRGVAGFTDHRFYEYSIPYDGLHDELGGTKGHPFTKGITMFCHDARGGPFLMGAVSIPANVGAIDGPWERIKLPQTPKANISSPAPGDYFFQNDSVTFDGANSSIEQGVTATYTWTFDGSATLTGASVPRSFATIGRHEVRLNITDSRGLSNVSYSYINIREKPVAPLIISSLPVSSISVEETETVNFTVTFQDDNTDVGDVITVNWSVNGVLKKTVEGGSSSGLTVKTSYDGEFSAGDYNITVELRDRYLNGTDPVYHSWNLNVTQKNRPPEITAHNPVESSLTGGDYTEETPVTFIIQKSDPDKDVMSVAWLFDNKEVAAARNKDTYTLLASPDYNSSGTHTVRVAVTDAAGAVGSFCWTIGISNINRAPRIETASPPEASTRVREGEKMTFAIQKSDPDGDQTTVKWLLNDNVLSDQTGTSFQFAPPFEGEMSSSGSPFTIKVQVADQLGLRAEKSWSVIVEEVNRAPIAIIAAPAEAYAQKLSDTAQFDASGSFDPDSPDNATLTYSWDFGDSRTGTGKQASHRYDKDGAYRVKLSVSDGKLTSGASVNITVRVVKLKLLELVLDRSSPRQGEKVNVTARVENVGELDAENFTVRFYLDTRTLAIETRTVIRLGASDSADIVFQWTATLAGPHTLFAELQPKTNVLIVGPPDTQASITVAAPPPKPPVIVNSPIPWLLMAGAAVGIVAAVGVIAAVMSRKKKTDRTVIAPTQAAVAPAHAPKPPKGDVQRKKPIRPRYEGKTVSIIVPGRDIAPLPVPAVTAPSPAPSPAPPALQNVCPSCGKPSTGTGLFCGTCAARERIAKSQGLLGSIKGKGVNVLPAERLIYQAQSALALGAFADVGALCAEAEENALKQERDSNETRKFIGEQEDKMANAIVEGRNTAEAETALARARTMMAEGRYDESREEAVTVSALLGAPVARSVSGEKPDAASPAPASPGKCPSCGEDVEPEWRLCPGCNTELHGDAPRTPVEPPGPAAPAPGKCPSCGEDVEAEWRLCPSCNSELHGDAPRTPVEPPGPAAPAPGKCPSCGEDVEAEWNVCPSCNSNLHDARPAALAPLSRGQELLGEAGELEKTFAQAEENGHDVKKGRNMLELATSFAKSGNLEKAGKYILRARGMAESLLER